MTANAPPRPHRPDRARTLYRALIKLCHPDLASGEEDRLRREEFTARVNTAYAEKDSAWLADLAREWQEGPKSAEPYRAEITELKAALDATLRQISEMRAEIARLTTAGLGELFGTQDPQVAVQRIAGRVRTEIDRQRALLRRLRGGS